MWCFGNTLNSVCETTDRTGGLSEVNEVSICVLCHTTFAAVDSIWAAKASADDDDVLNDVGTESDADAG